MPTPDTLDTRIRALVTELIESTPQAPVLPQLEWVQFPGAVEAPGPLPDRWHGRRPGTFRVLLATTVVLAALVAIVAAVTIGPRSRPLTKGPTPGHLNVTDQPPAAVSGTEETVASVGLPTFFTEAHPSTFSTSPPSQPSTFANCWNVADPEALSVDGSPPLVSWDASGNGGQPCGSAQSAAITYEGNGLDNGTGVDSDFDPANPDLAGTPTSVFVVTQWPAAGQDVYIWSGLPTTAAYVTYSYEDSVRVWEEPTDGVADLVVRPLFPDGAPFSVWHTAPFPVLSAYDSAGTLVGSVQAPRVSGDDFGMSPTGAG